MPEESEGGVEIKDGELGAGNLPEWPFGGGFRSVAGARAGRVQGWQ